MHIRSPRRDSVRSQTQHLHPQSHVFADLTCSRHHVCLSGPQQNDNICAKSCEEMLESPWHLTRLAAKTPPPPVAGQRLMLWGQRLVPQGCAGTLAFSTRSRSHCGCWRAESAVGTNRRTPSSCFENGQVACWNRHERGRAKEQETQMDFRECLFWRF